MGDSRRIDARNVRSRGAAVLTAALVILAACSRETPVACNRSRRADPALTAGGADVDVDPAA